MYYFVVFLWIFFRAENFSTAWLLIGQIVNNFDFAYILPFIDARSTWLIMIIVGFTMHSVSLKKNEIITDKFVNSPFWFKLAYFLIAVQLVIQFQSEDVQPFIYFQF